MLIDFVRCWVIWVDFGCVLICLLFVVLLRLVLWFRSVVDCGCLDSLAALLLVVFLLELVDSTDCWCCLLF